MKKNLRFIHFSIITILLSVPIAITAMDYPLEDQDGAEANSIEPIFEQLSTSFTYDAAGNRIRRKVELIHFEHDSLPGTII